jgi:short-subunit dehydrogenase
MSDRKVAIVTGASSGIGAATAVALALAGYNVVIAARRVHKLEAVAQRCRQAGAPAKVIPADVSQESQVNALVSAVVEEFGQLDVMVNNAGMGLFARVVEMTDRDMRALFDVNFHGVFYGAKAAAEVMMRQKHGHIFNVSSVIGKRGTPFHGAYCATKFAIVGLSDSLRVELAPYRVRVTTVCPSLTNTEFFDHSARGKAAQSSFSAIKGGFMPPEKVARLIVRAIGKNCPEIIVSAGGRFLVLMSALFPRLVDRGMKVYHDTLVKKAGPLDGRP